MNDSISGQLLDFEGNGAAEGSARDHTENDGLERRIQWGEKEAS